MIQESFRTGNFWIISISNLLVCTALYMLGPTTPFYFSSDSAGLACVGPVAYLLFALGTLLLAPFCNYWLDTFRRKNVMLLSLLGVLSFMVIMPFLNERFQLISRFFQGCAYGVFQISLGSTLLLDLSDSKDRTKVAHVYYWIQRIGLALGPIIGWYVMQLFTVQQGIFVLQGIIVVAVCILLLLTVPFLAPLEPKVLSLDRFWLLRGYPLAFPLLLVMVSVGISVSGARCYEFFIFLLIGLLVSVLLHILFLRERENSEVVLGLVFLIFANAKDLMQLDGLSCWLQGALFGTGIGLFTSRYLLSYIRICAHCERGTAQTSYWLCWELGLAFGYYWRLAVIPKTVSGSMYVLFILVFVLFYFVLFQRQWYLRNKRK